ncbi:hypothetical protein [Roseobacter sp.]
MAGTKRSPLISADTLYANTRNNPIEDIESYIPIQVDRYEFRENTMPAGQ